MQRKFQNIFADYLWINYPGNKIVLDLHKCANIKIINSSVAFGKIDIYPINQSLLAGQSWEINAKENEIYTGKIAVIYIPYFKDILPKITIIKKYFE